MSLISSATFNGAVLGVIYLDGSNNWAPSNFLGAPGTTYSEDPATCPQCGFEAGDTATVAGTTVNFNTTFSEPGDFARVITGGSPAASIPEPPSILLFGAGMAFIARKFSAGQGVLNPRRNRVDQSR